MKIEIAKTLPLPKILGKIGLKPIRKCTKECFYFSPFHDSKVATLVINVPANTWYDTTLDEGGDPLAFVCRYLKEMHVSAEQQDALRWMDNMFGNHDVIKPVPVKNWTEENKKYSVEGIWPLTYPALTRYVVSRGIPLDIADKHLKQVTVYNRAAKKDFMAVGSRNEDKGYELRSSLFKGSTNPCAITFIRGIAAKPDGFHVFHSIYDYLSLLTQRRGKPFVHDTIILNSLVCMKDASAYIKRYGYTRAYLWMDNTRQGKMAATSFVKFFRNEPGLQYALMNKRYAGFRDVNQAHMHRLGLLKSSS